MKKCIQFNFIITLILWQQGTLGIWGEELFILMELGCTYNYLRRAGEQTRTFGYLESCQKAEEKQVQGFEEIKAVIYGIKRAQTSFEGLIIYLHIPCYDLNIH